MGLGRDWAANTDPATLTSDELVGLVAEAQEEETAEAAKAEAAAE